jgi:hypothetical protein
VHGNSDRPQNESRGSASEEESNSTKEAEEDKEEPEGPPEEEYEQFTKQPSPLDRIAKRIERLLSESLRQFQYLMTVRTGQLTVSGIM